MQSKWHGVRAALSEPSYRDFTIGNIVSLVGSWVQRVAIGWLVWEQTGSGAWLGAVAFADLFPMVIVTPLAGAMADRSNRLLFTRISQALLTVHAGLLAALSVFGLLTPEAILGLVLVGGIITAFNQPFRMTLLPSMVQRVNLTSAVAVNSIVFNVARFIGPAIAGLIIAKGSVPVTFAFAFVTFVIFTWTLARLRLISSEQLPTTGLSLLRSVAEGWRYAGSHLGIGSMLLTLAVVSLFIRPILELMPGYAAMFDTDATAFAMMTSVFGLGSLVGATWLSRLGNPPALVAMSLVVGLVMGVAMVVAAVVTQEWIALVAIFVLGFGMVTNGIANQTAIQLAVPDHLRGRLLAKHSMIFQGGPAIGALVMGALSDVIGLRWPLAAGGIVTFAFACYTVARRKAILKSLDL